MGLLKRDTWWVRKGKDEVECLPTNASRSNSKNRCEYTPSAPSPDSFQKQINRPHEQSAMERVQVTQNKALSVPSQRDLLSKGQRSHKSEAECVELQLDLPEGFKIAKGITLPSQTSTSGRLTPSENQVPQIRSIPQPANSSRPAIQREHNYAHMSHIAAAIAAVSLSRTVDKNEVKPCPHAELVKMQRKVEAASGTDGEVSSSSGPPIDVISGRESIPAPNILDAFHAQFSIAPPWAVLDSSSSIKTTVVASSVEEVPPPLLFPAGSPPADLEVVCESYGDVTSCSVSQESDQESGRYGNWRASPKAAMYDSDSDMSVVEAHSEHQDECDSNASDNCGSSSPEWGAWRAGWTPRQSVDQKNAQEGLSDSEKETCKTKREESAQDGYEKNGRTLAADEVAGTPLAIENREVSGLWNGLDGEINVENELQPQCLTPGLEASQVPQHKELPQAAGSEVTGVTMASTSSKRPGPVSEQMLSEACEVKQAGVEHDQRAVPKAELASPTLDVVATSPVSKGAGSKSGSEGGAFGSPLSLLRSSAEASPDSNASKPARHLLHMDENEGEEEKARGGILLPKCFFVPSVSEAPGTRHEKNKGGREVEGSGTTATPPIELAIDEEVKSRRGWKGVGLEEQWVEGRRGMARAASVAQSLKMAMQKLDEAALNGSGPRPKAKSATSQTPTQQPAHPTDILPLEKAIEKREPPTARELHGRLVDTFPGFRTFLSPPLSPAVVIEEQPSLIPRLTSIRHPSHMISTPFPTAILASRPSPPPRLPSRPSERSNPIICPFLSGKTSRQPSPLRSSPREVATATRGKGGGADRGGNSGLAHAGARSWKQGGAAGQGSQRQVSAPSSPSLTRGALKGRAAISTQAKKTGGAVVERPGLRNSMVALSPKSVNGGLTRGESGFPRPKSVVSENAVKQRVGDGSKGGVVKARQVGGRDATPPPLRTILRTTI